MDLIYTDINYKELGYLKEFTLDLEIGKYGVASNDYELTIPYGNYESEFDTDCLFYYEGTEYGGIIEYKKVNTEKLQITFMGKTFRGLLEKEYVQPPYGSSHLRLKGEANACIQSLINGKFNDLFVVDDIDLSGINIDYNIRDLNLLQAIEKALATQNAKIDIKHQDDGKVHLKAVKINDLSADIQYDNNCKIGMVVETKIKPYNHILALGKGELTERLRVNLYMQEDGSWGDTECYVGLDKKTYKYEDTNEEDTDELKENAISKVIDVNKTDKLDISFDADNAELFDIVCAKEDITGVSFNEQITQKILKVTNNRVAISYKVGE